MAAFRIRSSASRGTGACLNFRMDRRAFRSLKNSSLKSSEKGRIGDAESLEVMVIEHDIKCGSCSTKTHEQGAGASLFYLHFSGCFLAESSFSNTDWGSGAFDGISEEVWDSRTWYLPEFVVRQGLHVPPECFFAMRTSERD